MTSNIGARFIQKKAALGFQSSDQGEINKTVSDMPVLNVPFRLIAAANPQRTGVLDNNLQPTKGFVFKFAVGSTF